MNQEQRERLPSMTEVARWSEREALRLQSMIEDDAPRLTTKLMQIGNGEWHVMLIKGRVYIWSEEDWEKRKNDPDIIAKRMIA